MRSALCSILLIIAAALPLPAKPAADDRAQPQMKAEMKSVWKIADGVYRIGKVRVDQNKGHLWIPAKAHMDSGLVEYLACGPEGKLHESVLKVEARPIHLQVGLLLLNLKPGRNLSFQGDPTIPTGSPVEIWAEWKTPSGKKRIRAEEWLRNRVTRRAVPAVRWVFTGSRFIDNKFAAEGEQSLISVCHDPDAIIDIPLEEAGKPKGKNVEPAPSPYGGEHSHAFEIIPGLVPRKGTDVILYIKAVPVEEKK
ncbi:MAG: hypothetical protein IT210_05905 [Armatimonadetes bacterium]|nr:hypothetical protein [Armatimonadota bacterium]